jgi:hypothetical protein
VEAGFDGAERDVEHDGRLGAGAVGEVHLLDHGALFRGECRQGAGYEDGVDDLVGVVADAQAHLAGDRLVLDLGGTPAFSPETVDGNVPRDLGQPSSDRTLLRTECVVVAPGPQHRLLDDILGLLPVPQHRDDQAA